MKAWLKCRVDEGMFPGEKAITVESGGEQFEYFVSHSELVFRAGDDRGAVRVAVLESNDKYSLIYMPGEPAEGPRLISVSNTDLEH